MNGPKAEVGVCPFGCGPVNYYAGRTRKTGNCPGCKAFIVAAWPKPQRHQEAHP